MRKQASTSFIETHDVKELKRITEKISPSIQLLQPHVKPHEIKPAVSVVVILSEDGHETLSILESNIVSDEIPVLYLGPQKQISTVMESYRSPRFIDYLTLPVSRELLSHKLQFLAKVHTLSFEHQNHAATLNQHLEIFYNRDGLTGLYTRRYLTDQLQSMMTTCLKAKEELSLLILNIDYFNNVNKSMGLDFEDFLLNAMAARLTSTISQNASCYRFSGEDFVVLLPGTPLVEATQIAQHINKICSEAPFSNGEQTVSITLSIGIASLLDHEAKNHTEFLSMAETALFTAKTEGRNRTLIYGGPGEPKDFSSSHTLSLLKENLSKIRERTRKSVIASLELLTRNFAETWHLEHIRMVSEYLDLFAGQLGLPGHHVQTFKNSIIIYSSLRCQLDKDIYSQPNILSKQERKTVEDLPFKLNELIDMFDYFVKERNVLLNHCERYDGTGYPLGLQKDEIPLSARIFHIIDALAAMSGERPYRKKLTAQQILNEFLAGAGRQFDPYLVNQIFLLLQNHQLIEVDPLMLRDKRQQLLDRFPELKS